MIYEFPGGAERLRQGDIFARLPRFDVSLTELLIPGLTEGQDETTTWEELLTGHANDDWTVRLAVAARPVSAIVITQDCDTIRAPLITLCEVRPLAHVVRDFPREESVPKFVKRVRRQTKENLKWFYLPPDPQIEFTEKMAADFQVTLTLPRGDLEQLRALRKGRLNEEAYQHFRERLSEFFRRYPVDEWYPLNCEEFEQYRRDSDEGAKPRPWQEPPDSGSAE